MEILMGILLFIGVWLLSGIRVVSQQTAVIVETFGKFSKTLEPGLNFIWFPPIQNTVKTVSLRIEELKSHVSVKTLDNTFVEMPVSIMVSVVSPEEAYYKLTNPSSQIQTWVLNAIRSIGSRMELQSLFDDRTHIISEVENLLSDKLAAYGYQLEGVLIDQPTLPQDMQEAFNSVVSAKRQREAATDQSEALRIQVTKQAQADAEAQETRAAGLANSRIILARGIKESLETLSDISNESAMEMLLATNRLDAMRDIGKHGNMIVFDMREGDQNHALTGLQSVLIKKEKLNAQNNSGTESV